MHSWPSITALLLPARAQTQGACFLFPTVPLWELTLKGLGHFLQPVTVAWLDLWHVGCVCNFSNLSFGGSLSFLQPKVSSLLGWSQPQPLGLGGQADEHEKKAGKVLGAGWKGQRGWRGCHSGEGVQVAEGFDAVEWQVMQSEGKGRKGRGGKKESWEGRGQRERNLGPQNLSRGREGGREGGGEERGREGREGKGRKLGEKGTEREKETWDLRT